MIDPLIETIADGLTLPAVRWPFLVCYLLLLGWVSLYGLHRTWLTWLYLRHGRRGIAPTRMFTALPSVTVQLPMFNEGRLTARIIDAACRLDYPRDRLQVQVLDDSTDESTAIARQRCAHWSAQGVDIQLLHRTDRAGFKAGALRDAMAAVTGTFIAIFDADFLPPADFLHRTIHHFTDEAVGMVQTRWDHLNRAESMLTRCQALTLDGHFVVEQGARAGSGRWFHFNGTAGVWRRQAIDTAGGWDAASLTEDLDLSYRSQLVGWRFVLLPTVACPAELPDNLRAFRIQQHRWNKGTIQSAMRLLPTLLRAPIPLKVKVEALLHLTCPLAYPLTALLTVFLLPAMFINLRTMGWGSLPMVTTLAGCLYAGVGSMTTFSVTAQAALGRSVWRTLLLLPCVIALGIGMSVSNGLACIEALLGRQSPFVRTPKSGLHGKGDAGRRRGTPWIAYVELGLAGYACICAAVATQHPLPWLIVPLLLLFVTGYAYVGVNSLAPPRAVAPTADLSLSAAGGS